MSRTRGKARRPREENQIWWLVGVLSVLISLVLIPATAVSSDRWQWEPHIVSLAYTVDGGEPKECDVLGGPPSQHSKDILADEGSTLAITSIRYALRPTRKYGPVEMVQTQNLEEASGRVHAVPRIRVKVSIRKFWGQKPQDEWYDERESHLSAWLDVGADVREIAFHDCSWCVGKDWDLVRLQIEQSADASKPAVVRQHEVALKPTSLKAQLRWRVRHNAYNTLAVEHPSTDKLLSYVAYVAIGIVVLLLIIIVGMLVAQRYLK